MVQFSPSGEDDLVTVEEASRLLGVSESQVHNLCKGKGQGLTKVAPPKGRSNHPPHAAVITRESLEELLRSRSPGQAPSTASSAQQTPPHGSRKPESARGRGAVQALKVQLDQAREQWREERRRSARLGTLLVQTATELRSALESREPLDAIADAYSAALTELLVDDDPGDLE